MRVAGAYSNLGFQNLRLDLRMVYAMPDNSGVNCKSLVLSDPARKVRFRVKKGSYERVHDWVRFRRDCEQAQQTTSSTTATSADLAVPTLNTLTTALPVNSEVRKARSFMPCQLV